MSIIDDVRNAAAGNWLQIHISLAGFTAEHADGAGHPCPICKDSGNDRFNVGNNYFNNGEVHCRVCKIGGDGFTALEKANGWSFVEAIQAVADHLGISKSDTPPIQVDLIEQLCRSKHMSIEAFRQFEPTIATRGRERIKCVRVAVYDGNGEQHSYFDLVIGKKGLFKPGKGSAGMFFPGRLPKPGETWHITEGVKDASALTGLGLNAAGLPMSFMADRYAGLFRGVDIILVPDLDAVGQTGAQKSGGNLSSIATSVSIARLPGEIIKTGGDDVRDVLRKKDGESLVLKAIGEAKSWQPREKPATDKDGRPEVIMSLDYGSCVDVVTGHLGKLGWNSDWIDEPNRDKLRLYHRGGSLVQIIEEKEECETQSIVIPKGSARIRPLPTGQLPLRISDCCSLVVEKTTKDGDVMKRPTPPPKWLVDGVATLGNYAGVVPRLEAIVSAPTLRPDGTIFQTPGYDKSTGLVYVCGKPFPLVPESPTLEDAKKAAEHLFEVVADFEFAGAADRSAWLSLVLSFIARPAIAGCVPLFGISATTRGSGKSLLVDAASCIAYGRTAARKAFASDDDEIRKSITAVALEALPAVLLDNVVRMLGGASLDAALTAMTWSDRVLGSSKTTGDLPLRTVWTATGNNLSYGSDLARRVLPVRLASTLENPEERTGFQHPDLLGWVADNRQTLAVSALTILRAYFVAGCPEQPSGAWGSFQHWSDLVRGSIVWAGLDDPLVTRESAKSEDSSDAIVSQLIGGMRELEDSRNGLTVRQILSQLEDPTMSHRFPTMREVVAEVATERGMVNSRRLGVEFRRYKGRIVKGFRLTKTLDRVRTSVWRVESVNADDAGDAGDAGRAGDVLADLSAKGVCVAEVPKTPVTHTLFDQQHGERSPASPASPAGEKPSPDSTDWIDDAEF